MKLVSHLIVPLAAFVIGFGAYARFTTSSGHAIATPIPPRKLLESGASSAILIDLRNGKPSAAREQLSRLAHEDPLEFFRLLHRHPWLAEFATAIEDASAALKWNEKSSFEALNQIQSPQLRSRAWKAYIGAVVGTIDDREIIDVALNAKHFTRHLLRPFLEEAVADRPESIFEVLGAKGIGRDGFFELLIKTHPEMFDTLLSSIQTGSRSHTSDLFDASEIRAREARDFDDLSASLRAHGDRGMYSTEIASWQTVIALRGSNTEGRASIYQGLAAQPDLVRNRSLAEVGSQAGIPPDELATVIEMVSSNSIRERILSDWLKSQPRLPSLDAGWISELPTLELQDFATQYIDHRSAQE